MKTEVEDSVRLKRNYKEFDKDLCVRANQIDGNYWIEVILININ